VTHTRIPPAGTMSRELIEETLTRAEPRFRSEDPYEQATAYTLAARAYTNLALHLVDTTLAMACRQAGAQYETLAARVRWANRIPTPFPRTELARLGLDDLRCPHCGHVAQVYVDEAPKQRCPDCPVLLFGVTPTSQEEAATLPPGEPVSVTRTYPEEGE
jgi:hypothetical protein